MFGHCGSSDLPLSTRVIQHSKTNSHPAARYRGIHDYGVQESLVPLHYRWWAGNVDRIVAALEESWEGKSVWVASEYYGISKSTLGNYACGKLILGASMSEQTAIRCSSAFLSCLPSLLGTRSSLLFLELLCSAMRIKAAPKVQIEVAMEELFKF